LRDEVTRKQLANAESPEFAYALIESHDATAK
jgi:hypothetical protein